jgi:alpha-amylase/alpha-mannosidase (GH57 family)
VLTFGTWPVEPEQALRVTYQVRHPDGSSRVGDVDAAWHRNEGVNSYWHAEIGSFSVGDEVTYAVRGLVSGVEVAGGAGEFRVAPKLYVALLWHQHQPIYRDTRSASGRGSYRQPWVRLHATRDYYSMAAMVAQHPEIHLTINLSPSLLWQIEDYVQSGATDRALDLTLQPADELTEAEREEILSSFFDADWHNQIFPHPRYKELFLQRVERRPFSTQDLRDLQAWFNLVWFGKEFRDGDVTVEGGDRVSIHRFIEQGRGFSQADVRDVVAAQYAIMRAVIPIHRAMQDKGQIEISTTPFYHPILPLIVDTDRATIDRPGARHPSRFFHPEDADTHVRRAVDLYERRFGRCPTGMWPAEGAVSQFVVPIFARHGLAWIATDGGVLARSGRWGYEAHDPDVLCQPYRTEERKSSIAVFFRDGELSDAIGFRYHAYEDPQQAASDFVKQIKEHVVARIHAETDHVLTIILDGENAWGAYRDDGRPFLHALYEALARDGELQAVTLAEYIQGNAVRGVRPHGIDSLTRVHDLFTGSWIDETGSAPGVDLGTWIGEPEENLGWELLLRAREFLTGSGADTDRDRAAFEALYVAEGSDWFWWLGADQDSGSDDEFDDLFRAHLKNIYLGVGATPPADLDRHLVPHAVVWTFARQVPSIQPGDRLAVVTNCRGRLAWQIDAGHAETTLLEPVGGVMAGAQRYSLTLGPFPKGASLVRLRFECMHRGCDCRDACCRGDEHVVRIEGEPAL